MWILIYVILSTDANAPVNLATSSVEFVSLEKCEQAQLAVKVQLSTFGTTVRATCVQK